MSHSLNIESDNYFYNGNIQPVFFPYKISTVELNRKDIILISQSFISNLWSRYFNLRILWPYLSPYRHTYNFEKMSTNLNDTLPLSTENYNENVIEISDDEKTYYGSNFSISEDSEDSSIQFLCEIINLENSNSQNLQAPNMICRAILLELLQEMIE